MRPNPAPEQPDATAQPNNAGTGPATQHGAPEQPSDVISGAGAAPALDGDALRAVCRTVSDIHAKLALAYAYGLTFQRAIRDFIPIDELDILPCLSEGVLDVLDTQLPRLDALLDQLALTAATVPAARASPQRTLRHSRRSRDFDSSQAAYGVAEHHEG